MADQQSKTVQSIIEYLQSLKSDESKVEQINNVVGILQETFELTESAENFEKFSYFPHNLSDIFEAGVNALNLKDYTQTLADAKSNPKFDSFVEVVDKKGYFKDVEEGSLEHMKRMSNVIVKFKSKVKSSEPTQEEKEKQAEDLKFKGNTAINAKNYDEAIRLYTEALALSSDGVNSHVYYSNRAAAHCHLNNYQEAVDDCELCLSLNPTYVKAYSRLGLANFFLGRYEESVDAYQKAVDIEPNNKQSQDSLRQAKNKLRKAKASTLSTPTGGAPADLPSGLAGMMNNPNMKKAMDQMGGASGLADMMKDPSMMAMAQQMMKDPAMMQQAMSMLGGAGGAGGMPDMSALAGMMGGMGGAPPVGESGVTPSSSSSKSGAKKPFKGFEE